MKLIPSKAELITQGEGLQGIFKMIELAGRTCYKSEANITSDSASEFVGRMVKSGHTAMLEHGTVYLKTNDEYYGNPIDKYRDNKYSQLKSINGTKYVTTNLCVLVENGWLEDLKYICKPTQYHEKRYTMKFITDRGVSHKRFVA